ncbi:hypothetical protein SCANM63S_00150 [Streptomyces canarius]
MTEAALRGSPRLPCRSVLHLGALIGLPLGYEQMDEPFFSVRQLANAGRPPHPAETASWPYGTPRVASRSSGCAEPACPARGWGGAGSRAVAGSLRGVRSAQVVRDRDDRLAVPETAGRSGVRVRHPPALGAVGAVPVDHRPGHRARVAVMGVGRGGGRGLGTGRWCRAVTDGVTRCGGLDLRQDNAGRRFAVHGDVQAPVGVTGRKPASGPRGVGGLQRSRGDGGWCAADQFCVRVEWAVPGTTSRR